MSPEFLSTAETYATIIGVIVAATALVYSALQLRLSRRTSQGQFLMHFGELLQEYHDIGNCLRPRTSKALHCSPDWPLRQHMPRLEAYLSLFERMEQLLADGVADRDAFYAIYGFRVDALFEDEGVRRMICSSTNKARNWQKIISLKDQMSDNGRSICARKASDAARQEAKEEMQGLPGQFGDPPDHDKGAAFNLIRWLTEERLKIGQLPHGDFGDGSFDWSVVPLASSDARLLAIQQSLNDLRADVLAVREKLVTRDEELVLLRQEVERHKAVLERLTKSEA